MIATQSGRAGSPTSQVEAFGKGGQSSGKGGEEFLAFRIGSEEYGVGILKVQEIRSYQKPTRIANAPSYVQGVINLRGVIVPVIDLRLKLGCDTPEFDISTVVVVLNVGGRVVGAVVDAVSDVLLIDSSLVKEAPTFACSLESNCITGIATIRGGAGMGLDKDADRMIILIDIEAMMGSIDIQSLEF